MNVALKGKKDREYNAIGWPDAKSAFFDKKKVFLSAPTAKFHKDGEGFWRTGVNGRVIFANHLVCSFSGGRTSGMMAKRLKDLYPSTRFVFANTGCEHEETLKFVDLVDREFSLGLSWVETVFNGYDAPLGFKVVDFNSCSRKGEPFEAVVMRHGLPNQTFPHCSRELKKYTINRYLRACKINSRFMAIGIRADEIDRCSDAMDEEKLYYPLMEDGIRKSDVFRFWNQQDFDLNLETKYGNCVGCWKKSDEKLRAIAFESPEQFDFFRHLQDKYGSHFPASQSRRRHEVNFMYREFKRPEWYLENSRKEVKTLDDRERWLQSVADELQPCESCEAF